MTFASLATCSYSDGSTSPSRQPATPPWAPAAPPPDRPPPPSAAPSPPAPPPPPAPRRGIRLRETRGTSSLQQSWGTQRGDLPGAGLAGWQPRPRHPHCPDPS
ncbi:hypothetical protein C1I93_29765 [Micromonospora endophytica]|uniref:Uncharacterized protein n=1 Tax=Micromonospora endophytica TaxID=515350 RepID=A0A2W2C6U2_9ACTN|nr:hypothetical protein C1I93_29765 [Micromonospora endophytica]RIW40259.1 hypothetical protein D3H59_29595 [Micromonospora endophytica]